MGASKWGETIKNNAEAAEKERDQKIQWANKSCGFCKLRGQLSGRETA